MNKREDETPIYESFLQDDASAHFVLFVKAFFAKYGIAMLEHLSYSPDKEPWNFLRSNCEAQRNKIWKYIGQMNGISQHKSTSSTGLHSRKFEWSCIKIAERIHRGRYKARYVIGNEQNVLGSQSGYSIATPRILFGHIFLIENRKSHLFV